MNSDKRNLGEQLYKLVENNGAPWGVGTTAIVAGLGTRLLHMAVKNSAGAAFTDEIKALFNLCDEDDYLFDNYLHHMRTNLNKVPIRMQNMLLLILEKALKEDYEIKDDLKVDFNMGIQYLITAAEQTIKIMIANEIEGISKKQFDEWQQMLLIIKERAANIYK